MSQVEMNHLPGPSFWRRVACNLYEQLVLLGVLALTFLLPNLALGMLLQVSLPSWLTFFYFRITVWHRGKGFRAGWYQYTRY